MEASASAGALRAVDRNPALARAKAEQRLAKTVLARVRQAADAKNLARTNLEADAVKPRRLEVRHRQDHRIGFRTRSRIDAPGRHVSQVPPDHGMDQALLGQVLVVQRLDRAAVAHDGDAIGEVEHLAQVVRNIDDRHAFGAQLAHDVEQALALATRQSGIGLVEHKHAGALTDGARNFDELHLGDRQPAHARVRIERVHAETFERGASLRAHHRPRHERGDAPARHVGHDDILGDRHRRAEGELLIDDDDARSATVERGSKMRRLAVDKDLAFAWAKIAREDMHERGLAGAVLANDRVNFASAKAQVDMVERKNAREPSGHPGDLDDMRTGRHLRPVLADALLLGDLVDIVLRVDADARIDALDRLAVQELHEKIDGLKTLFLWAPDRSSPGRRRSGRAAPSDRGDRNRRP